MSITEKTLFSFCSGSHIVISPVVGFGYNCIFPSSIVTLLRSSSGIIVIVFVSVLAGKQPGFTDWEAVTVAVPKPMIYNVSPFIFITFESLTLKFTGRPDRLYE